MFNHYTEEDLNSFSVGTQVIDQYGSLWEKDKRNIWNNCHSTNALSLDSISLQGALKLYSTPLTRSWMDSWEDLRPEAEIFLTPEQITYIFSELTSYAGKTTKELLELSFTEVSEVSSLEGTVMVADLLTKQVYLRTPQGVWLNEVPDAGVLLLLAWRPLDEEDGEE